jgi:hypothetical protein
MISPYYSGSPGVHYKLTKDVHTLAVLSERISQMYIVTESHDAN